MCLCDVFRALINSLVCCFIPLALCARSRNNGRKRIAANIKKKKKSKKKKKNNNKNKQEEGLASLGILTSSPPHRVRQKEEVN